MLPLAKRDRTFNGDSENISFCISMNVHCVCGAFICSASLVTRYQQQNAGIHLVVRPESEAEFLRLAGNTWKPIENPKKKKRKWTPIKLQCISNQCAAKDFCWGSQCKIGPENELLYCFAFKNATIDLIDPCHTHKRWADYFEENHRLFSRISLREHKEIFFAQNPEHSLSLTPNTSPVTIPTLEDIGSVLNRDVYHLTRSRPRAYQLEMFLQSFDNSIICLPTGSGKTLIAAMIFSLMREVNRDRLCVFIVDRIPLVFQQGQYFREQIPSCSVLELYGEIRFSMKLTCEKLLRYDVLVITAQLLRNLFSDNVLHISMISALIIDEVHHATKEHPFKKILEEQGTFSSALTIGLTASPVSRKTFHKSSRQLGGIMNVLNAQVLSPQLYSDDLKFLLGGNGFQTFFKQIPQTPLEQLFIDMLLKLIREDDQVVAELKDKIPLACLKRVHDVPITQLNSLVNEIEETYRRRNLSLSERYAMALFMCLKEVLESDLKSPLTYARNIIESNELCPQIVKEFVEENANLNTCDRSSRLQLLTRELHDFIQCEVGAEIRVIIFVPTRDAARNLVRKLSEDDLIHDTLSPEKFVGHGQYDGMSWEEEQSLALERFRVGETKCLVSTSILEEGLDIPACNLVISYKSVGNIRQFIQQRGRARAANSFGKYVVLLDTHDNPYEMRKEMERLESINQQVVLEKATAMWKSREIRGIIEGFLATTNENQHICSEYIQKNAEFVDSKQFLVTVSNASRFSHSLAKIGAELSELTKSNVSVCDVSGTELFLSVQSSENEETVAATQLDCSCEHLQNAGVSFSDYSTFLPKLQKVYDSREIWFRLLFERDLHICSCPIRIDLGVSSMTRGFFTSRCDFVSVETTQLDAGCFLTAESNSGIYFHRGTLRMELKFQDIDKSVLFNDEEEIISIFIPLKQSPSYYNNVRNGLIRSTRPLSGKSLVWEFGVSKSGNEDRVNTFRWILESNYVSVYDCNDMKRSVFPGLNNPRDGPNMYELMARKREVLIEFVSFCSSMSCFLPDLEWILSNPGLFDLWNEHFDSLEYVFRKLRNFGVWDRFCDMHKVFSEYLENHKRKCEILTKRNLEEILCLSSKEENCFTALSCIITPTRLIYRGEDARMSNRVLRTYGSKDFLVVRFRDENWEKVDRRHGEVLKHFEHLMLTGIRFPGTSDLFKFLGTSNSQLRSGNCLFTCRDPWAIIHSLGDFSHIKTGGKFLSRIGLAFSSSVNTVLLEKKFLEDKFLIDDVTVGNYVFTDGVGKISVETAEKVSVMLGLKYTPSAFQIRIGGCKGVLTVDPRLASGIQLRPSMKKFPVSPETPNCLPLEILRYSQGYTCYLNRQVIQLLSAHGITDAVFFDMLKEELESIRQSLCDPTGVRQQLKKHSDSLVFSHIPMTVESIEFSGFNLLEEPLFQQILRSLYRKDALNLINRAHVYVEKGRVLLGVIDETKTLQEDEIFCQLSQPGNHPPESIAKYLPPGQTHVIVYRNPCHVTGDIQRVRPVAPRNCPALSHIVDCVVFPCVGPRPIPDMCTGGDLDGDLYTVIWDPALIPSGRIKPYVMDFTTDPAVNNKTPKESSPRMEEIVRAYMPFLQQDKLGRISNAHMAVSDFAKDGPHDQNAIQLARAASLSVDAMKSQITPEVPRDLFPRKYPDFMMKNNQPTYLSDKVLGRMFRKTQQLPLHFLNERTPGKDPMFRSSANDEAEAEVVFRNYRSEVSQLLKLYDIETEAMIISAEPDVNFSYTQHTQHNTSRLCEEVQKKFLAIVRKYRSLADRRIKEGRDPILLAASWYEVAGREPGNAFSFFPWILHKELCTMKRRKKSSRACQRAGVDRIAINLSRYAMTALRKRLGSREKFKIRTGLENLVDDPDVNAEELAVMLLTCPVAVAKEKIQNKEVVRVLQKLKCTVLGNITHLLSWLVILEWAVPFVKIAKGFIQICNIFLENFERSPEPKEGDHTEVVSGFRNAAEKLEKVLLTHTQPCGIAIYRFFIKLVHSNESAYPDYVNYARKTLHALTISNGDIQKVNEENHGFKTISNSYLTFLIKQNFIYWRGKLLWLASTLPGNCSVSIVRSGRMDSENNISIKVTGNLECFERVKEFIDQIMRVCRSKRTRQHIKLLTFIPNARELSVLGSTCDSDYVKFEHFYSASIQDKHMSVCNFCISLVKQPSPSVHLTCVERETEKFIQHVRRQLSCWERNTELKLIIRYGIVYFLNVPLKMTKLSNNSISVGEVSASLMRSEKLRMCRPSTNNLCSKKVKETPLAEDLKICPISRNKLKTAPLDVSFFPLNISFSNISNFVNTKPMRKWKLTIGALRNNTEIAITLDESGGFYSLTTQRTIIAQQNIAVTQNTKPHMRFSVEHKEKSTDELIQNWPLVDICENEIIFNERHLCVFEPLYARRQSVEIYTIDDVELHYAKVEHFTVGGKKGVLHRKNRESLRECEFHLTIPQVENDYFDSKMRKCIGLGFKMWKGIES